MSVFLFRYGKNELPYDLKHASSVPCRKSFLLVGGLSTESGSNVYTDALLKYDVKTERWVTIMTGKLTAGKSSFAALLVNCLN